MGKFSQLIPYLKSIDINFRQPTPNRRLGWEISTHRGFSEERRESRPYRQGDEIRYIDWRLYARTDRFFIREGYFPARREIEIFLDLSPSVLCEKKVFETSLLLCLSLYYLFFRKKNKTILQIFSLEEKETLVPKSEQELIILEDYLMNKYLSKKQKYKGQMDFLIQELLPKKKEVVFFLSDLYLPYADLDALLINAKSYQLYLTIFHIFQIPENIPERGYFSVLVDSETGDWQSGRLMSNIREIWEKGVTKRYNRAHSLGIPVIPVQAGENLLRILDNLGYL